MLVAGQLSDRYGRKPVLFPGLAAAVLACILFGTASTVASLLIARLLSGIAVGVIVSAGMASVADVGGPARRKTAALAASVAMVLGAGLGPLLSGIFSVSLAQPVVPLFGTQLLILFSAFAVAGSLPRTLLTARQSEWRLRLPSVPKGNRLHLALGIAVFAPGITSTSFILSLGPSLLKQLLGGSNPLVAGGTACLMFLLATGVQLLLKRFSIRNQLLLGAASVFLAMLCMSIAAYASAVAPLVLAAMLAGAGQGLGQLGGLTLIGLHVPEHRRAEANAVLNIGGYIPAAILPVCTGYLIDYTGIASGATAFAAILAAAASAAAWFVRVKLP